VDSGEAMLRAWAQILNQMQTEVTYFFVPQEALEAQVGNLISPRELILGPGPSEAAKESRVEKPGLATISRSAPR